MSRASVFDAAPSSLLIYQVEPTNWCNATCTYCPQPTHARERGYMTPETWARTLSVMRNTEVLLHHFGESLLHKQLDTLLLMGRAAGKRIGISSNGKGLTQARLDHLTACGLAWLRLHTDPFNVRARDFTAPRGLELSEHRLLVKSDAPKKELQSFAGHLDVTASGPGAAGCSYLADGWRVVLWDGQLALCCNDVEGDGLDAGRNLCAGCTGYVFTGPLEWGAYSGAAQ